MPVIKIENFIKQVWSKNKIRLPDDVIKLVNNIEEFQNNFYKENPKLTINRVKNDIRNLRASKKDFIKKSLLPKKVKKEFFLDDEDLEKIKHTEAYGVVRILREDILDYLKNKNEKKYYS